MVQQQTIVRQQEGTIFYLKSGQKRIPVQGTHTPGLGFGPTLQLLFPQQRSHTPHIMVVVRARDVDGDQQRMPMELAQNIHTKEILTQKTSTSSTRRSPKKRWEEIAAGGGESRCDICKTTRSRHLQNVGDTLHKHLGSLASCEANRTRL